MFIKLLAMAAIAFSFAGTAQAHELDAIMHHHYLLGKWSCVGHVHTPDGERVNTVGSWKIKRAFHGHVYDRFENYAGNGVAYKAKGMTTYDKLAGCAQSPCSEQHGQLDALCLQGVGGRKHADMGRRKSPLWASDYAHRASHHQKR